MLRDRFAQDDKNQVLPRSLRSGRQKRFVILRPAFWPKDLAFVVILRAKPEILPSLGSGRKTRTEILRCAQDDKNQVLLRSLSLRMTRTRSFCDRFAQDDKNQVLPRSLRSGGRLFCHPEAGFLADGSRLCCHSEDQPRDPPLAGLGTKDQDRDPSLRSG